MSRGLPGLCGRREVAWTGDAEEDGGPDEQDEDDDADGPDVALVPLPPEVLEANYADQEARDGAGNVRGVADRDLEWKLFYLIYFGRR
jgi:hypothetical protein